MRNEQKKVWSAPMVRKYGSFEEATQGHDCTDKDYGNTDGHTFQGVAIACAS